MNSNNKSINIKLWLYFTLFAALILLVLWLLQIVLLQSFYESMKTREVEQMAETIAEAYGQDDFETIIDGLTLRSSALVYVTDSDGELLYSSDEHGSGAPDEPGINQDVDPSIIPGDKSNNDFYRNNMVRALPSDFSEFLYLLQASDDGTITYKLENQQLDTTSLVFGVELDGAIIYIRCQLDPVNSTTDILSRQLVYVTIASLLLSLVVAFFIARKISKPIKGISNQAHRLAEGEFDVTFERGFCSEIDELAETLDHTAIELSKVEKLRNELISNISHDLRTPLTMVKAYAEMIRDISGDNPEKREEHLAIICDETDRLTTLVNDVLELSVIQSGNDELHRVNMSISDTVMTVVSRFTPMAERDGYVINAIVEPDQYILADEQKITQVLYNLIANAINYVGGDKIVEIRLDDIGGRIRFEVADHGVGIAGDELPLIWDRYYKAKTHTRSKVGTGLGLSIVRGILEMHKARFGVKSDLGKGSTFWFEMMK